MKKLLLLIILIFAVSAFGQRKTGSYAKKGGDGEIKIVETIKFSLWVVGTATARCVGVLKGKAKLTNSNFAEFKDNSRTDDGELIGCRLYIVFAGRTLTIRQDSCSYYHGAACNFDGDYIRK